MPKAPVSRDDLEGYVRDLIKRVERAERHTHNLPVPVHTPAPAPPYVPPPVSECTPAWFDDFERTSIGSDWVLGLYSTPATTLNQTLELATLVSGVATGPNARTTTPDPVMSMSRAVGTDTGHQAIEVEIENLCQTVSDGYLIQLELATYSNPTTGVAWSAQFTWEYGDATASMAIIQYAGLGSLASGPGTGDVIHIAIPSGPDDNDAARLVP